MSFFMQQEDYAACIYFWGSLFPQCEPVFFKWHAHLYTKRNNNKADVDFV